MVAGLLIVLTTFKQFPELAPEERIAINAWDIPLARAFYFTSWFASAVMLLSSCYSLAKLIGYVSREPARI